MRVFAQLKLLNSNGGYKIVTGFIHNRGNMPKKLTKLPNVHDAISSHESRNSAVRLAPNGNIELRIQAKPSAKQNAITGIDDNEVSVQIAAQATDGAANTELVHYLSKVLGIRKGDLSLDKGSKSRQKIITLATSATDLSVESVVAKLRLEQSS